MVIFMLKTVEDALEEILSMLYKMRALAERAANDTLTSRERAYIQLEIDELKDGIDRIAETMRLGESDKKRLLDDSSSALRPSDGLSAEAIIRGWQLQNQDHGQIGRS